MNNPFSTALLKARQPGDPLPKRLQIFKFGVNPSNQGDFIVDAQCLSTLLDTQRTIGRERVPIGFEHNIDEGSEEYNRTTEPRPIAGMGAIEPVSGEGIFLSAIDWNQSGQDNAHNYEDLSPTPLFDKKTRRVLAITSVSLTRTGSIYGLTLDNAAAAKLSALLCGSTAAAAPGLTGMDRVVAAFQRQNDARTRATATLAAATPALPPIDPALTGLDRVVATYEREYLASQQRK
jgi:hypothetical protein